MRKTASHDFIRSVFRQALFMSMFAFIIAYSAHASQDRFGGVFHDGDDAHNLLAGMTWTELGAQMKEFGEVGQKLVDVEIIQRQGMSTRGCDPPVFAGVWREGDYGQSLVGGLSWPDFFAAATEQRQRYGMWIVDIETHVECGVRKYVGVFNRTVVRGILDRPQMIKNSMTWEAFVWFFATYHSAGYHMIDMETYVDNGTRYWAAIWNIGTKDEWLYAWSRKEFEQNQESVNGSQRLVDMESWLDEGGRVVAGLFYGSADPAIMELGENWQKFIPYWEELSKDKKRLVDLEVFPDTVDRRWHNTFYDAFNGKIMGWQYSVFEDGNRAAAGGEGWARAPTEPLNPGIPMEPTSVLNIASITKLFTTIGIMELDEQNLNLLLDMPFAAYLQSIYTDFGAGVWNVTVRDLLTQDSGMAIVVGSQWDALGNTHAERVKNWVAMDLVGTPGGGNTVYYNPHYDLLLKVIEIIMGQDYITWMNANVLSKVGIGSLACSHANNTDATLYYEYLPDNNNGNLIPGVQPGSGCFGGSWYASTDDVAGLMAALRKGLVLDPSSLKTMRDQAMAQYAWWQNSDVYQKNGGLAFYDGAGKCYGMATDVMSFPDGFDVALNINSWPNANDTCDPGIVVEQLIYDAWIAQEDW
ncbi:MAG: serine hydrolase domain-containing protein [Planctomycetota bacterium]|jgi:CubicO group peptidase (beta-lactamase class C family)